VWQLSEVSDQLSIPVLCYGIRTDFQGQLFPGSKALLAWADELQELKTIWALKLRSVAMSAMCRCVADILKKRIASSNLKQAFEASKANFRDRLRV